MMRSNNIIRNSILDGAEVNLAVLMLQPRRLQRTDEPTKVKKTANVLFKPVWKPVEIAGKDEDKDSQRADEVSAR